MARAPVRREGAHRVRRVQLLRHCGASPLSAAAPDLLALVHAANTHGPKTVYDMSSPTLQACLAGEPWLVKINMSEARQVLARPWGGHDLVRGLLESGAKNVVLTDGPETIYGCLLGTAFTAHPPSVVPVSAVGCGDCFLAGLLFEMSRHQTRVEEIIKTAAATASASAEHPQPGFFSPARAADLRSSAVVRCREE
ncbi:PfkB family carbohydrate kinase [Streptomyces sp. NPDC002187]|uniref:PfkB family carbohydrate kinase n=1 Tax=Streptomyces sp. NPDC002187 TaxID=3364637 RepID=UPI00368E1B5B